MRLYLTALASLFLFVSCATNTGTEGDVKGIAKFEGDPRLGEEVNRICFNRNIDSFQNATRDTIVLSSNPNRQYIVEVRPGCIGLQNARSVAVDTTLTCITQGDFLLVSRSSFSLNDGDSSTGRCFINAMHEWDRRAKAPDEETSER